MKVVVAGHFVQQGRVGGAEHMLYNLLRGMNACGTQVSLLCTELDDLERSFVDEMKRNSVAVLPQGQHVNRFVSEQLSCLKSTLHADAVLFPNYFTPPAIPPRLGRVVTVIHDLQYLRFRELTPAARLRWLRLTHGLTFMRADSVVVLSEFVRDEVRKFYGNRAADKAIVIPNPISWTRFGEDSPRDDRGRPYILSVAAHYPHKNLAVLIQALSIVRRSMDVRLVLVGQFPSALLGVKDRSRDPAQLVRDLGLTEHVELTGYVDDQTLGRYYRNARLFAFPSLYEGFGMPAVEALGLGLPTVTTRCASLPEVTLGEATYVDAPQDPQEWAATLLAILRDPSHRPSAQVQARIRTTYDPKRIAELYLRQCRG